MSKVQRASHIYRKHGFVTLLQRSTSWTLWKIKSIVLLNDVTETSVGNITAKFITETRKEHSRFEDLMGEREVLEDFLSEISSDDIFYDIGANVGVYTCFAGNIIDPDLIFAFEPHPENADRLDQNLELNDISAQVERLALSHESGTAELEIRESGEVGVGSHSLSTGHSQRTIEIPTAQGDEVIDDKFSPTVMKIDVEGAEMNVLRGFEESISNCRVVYCEIHPQNLTHFDSTSEQVHDYFEEHGFALEKKFEFSGHSSGYMVKFKNKNL